ncbi:MAG: hypothetical protein RIQ89_627 [Bacteroidota bacterium]|jgi:LacI family transcriptional regulator
MKRITLKDLAGLLGVNTSTVSRALKDHPDIGVELREKIKRLAKDLNYHPNMMAVQLRKQKSNLIGLIIPDAIMFFFPSVIKGISEVIQKNNYKLLVLQSGENLEQEEENVRICFENGVDGLLITLTNQTHSLNHLNDLRDMNIPIILVDKIIEENSYDKVFIDDQNATEICINHLAVTGCRRIIGVFGNENLRMTKSRLDGFTVAAQKYQLTTEIVHADGTFEAMKKLSQSILKFKPDGIFAMSDETLAGAVPAIKKLGLKIPQDCSVVAISDGFLPQILDPTITFLHHDGLELGRLAAKHLISKLQNKENPYSNQTIHLPVNLEINDSTKPWLK